MALDTTSPQVITPDFVPRLSAELLLQPDVMYPYARMLAASRASQTLRAFAGGEFDLARLQMLNGQVDAATGTAANIMAAMANGVGGPLDLNVGFEFPDMVKMVMEASQPGTQINMNRPVYINGTTTASSRQLGAGNRVFGTHSQPVTMEQVALEIVEYLGPTNAAGTLAPISVPRFTMHRSAHDLLVDVGVQLRRDRVRFIDALMQALIIAAATNAGYITRPSGMTSNSTYTAADNEPMSFDLLVAAGRAMKDRGIPGLGGSPRYLAILPTKAMQDLKGDPAYQKLAEFHPQYNPLFPGYVRTVDSMIVIESNNATSLASQGVGNAVTLYQSVILAPGAFGWAAADDVRAMRNGNDDGGRSNEFAWSAYEAFKVLDDKFFQLILTD